MKNKEKKMNSSNNKYINKELIRSIIDYIQESKYKQILFF